MPPSLRVLYVDDDPGLLEIGKLFLEQSGRFSVDIITSAPAALTLLNATKYDAIISDYQMPGMDGIGFLKSVRASGNTIPFILFTGRGREEIVIQALNEGANFYLQKGGEPEAQFAELVHKIQISVEHHRAAEKIQALNRLYSVLSATNKAIFRIQTKDEFFLEICRILVETGGFRMAWIGLADLEQKIIRPVVSAGYVDGYLDTINISTEDVPKGRGPTGTAFREGKYFWSNDITLDPRMEPWRENALKRGYLANAAFSFSLGTNNAGTLSVYAPVTGFFDAPIIDLLEELSVDISFYLRTIDEQAKRKSAEEGLQQEQLFSKSVLDSLPGIFYLYTYPDCRLVLWNKQHEVLLGYETGEMKGRHVTDWHAPESKELVMNAIETVMKTGQGSMDAILLTKDGHKVPFFLTGVRFEANGELYVMGIGIDVTERKQVEADLRASEEALSAMLNGITESAFLMTPEGTTLAANETVARRLGMKQAEDMIGQNALRLLPEDVQMSRQIKIKEVIQSGQPAHFEDVRLGRVISQTIYPVKDPDGTVRRLAIFGVDVTDQKLTEEALHETSKRLSFALRSAKSGTWDWDFPTGKLVWSPEFFELFGLPPEITQSFETWLAALHPDDRKPAVEKIDQSVTNHKNLWNEYRVLLPDGSVRWIGASGSTAYNDSGEPLRMSGVCIDISERKKAEEALRESEGRFHSMFERHDSVMLLIYPETGKIIDANLAAERFYGRSRKELCAMSIDQINILSPEEVTAEMMKAVREQNNFFTFPHLLANGEIRTVEVHSSPIDMGGKIVLFSIINDITERKRAEEALRESEEKYRILLDESLDPVFSFYPDGTYRYVNRAFATGVGKPVDQITGKKIWEVFDKEEAEKRFSSLRMVFATGNEKVIEVRVPHPGGDRYYVTTIVPVKDENGAVVSAICSSKDITPRKQAEEALRQANKKLNLMSSVTRHDIVNNIMVCRGYLALSKEQSLPADMLELIAVLEQYLGAIQSQIEFTRVYQDLGMAAPVWQDIRSILQKCSAAQKVPVISGISNLEVYADPLIGKVFYNLHDNAVRHGEHATEIHVRTEKRGNDMVIVWQDNGIGVLPGEKEQIFERGFGKNTGLGLFLVREILDITGITIKETGEPGKGARFEMTVPNGAWRKGEADGNGD